MRVTVARGALVLSQGRRFAMLERDADGDLIALLSDRSTDVEATAWEVDPAEIGATVGRMAEFVMGQERRASSETIAQLKAEAEAWSREFAERKRRLVVPV
jgi:hypothetical protein